MSHVPVLLHEVLESLKPGPGKKFIDATANGGGHTSALREAGADVLAIEWDPELAKRIGAVNDSYVNIVSIAKEHGFMNCDGVLFDLGFSSWQMEESGKGFSFQRDEPLDMRYSNQGETAADILNTWPQEEIARILKEYGEERFDGRIAGAIMKARPIQTTFELVRAIESVVHRSGKINPATRTFQALRITVNHELENVQKGLEGAWEVLKPGGKLAVISFHSLEDRIVKNFIKLLDDKSLPAGRQVIRARWEEIKTNRRARSAKLRVVERTTPAT